MSKCRTELVSSIEVTSLTKTITKLVRPIYLLKKVSFFTYGYGPYTRSNELVAEHGSKFSTNKKQRSRRLGIEPEIKGS